MAEAFGQESRRGMTSWDTHKADLGQGVSVTPLGSGVASAATGYGYPGPN